ncbi:MAG: HAMP domain-containing histidine kinase [Acidobacteriota bacterium]|nr:HAMP domain-containing histidine kinase [Acidobacteriota bacterium]
MIVLGIVVVTLEGFFATSYESVAAQSLNNELRAFSKAATLRPAHQTLEAFAVHYLHTHALASGGAVLILFPNGARVQTAGTSALYASSLIRAFESTPPTRSFARAVTIGHHPVELAAAPLYEGATYAGTVIATADLTPFAAERSRVLELSLAEATIALLAGIAGTYILLRQLLRTIGRVTSTADELGRSSLDQRLGDQGRDDEVGDLARTFDEMLDRIDAVVQAQSRLLADVSHQLRTPLTVARGHLEVLARTATTDPDAVSETLGLVVEEIAHMSVMVERLLMLGHAMDPEFLETQPVDLRTLFADCFAASRVLGERVFTLGALPDVVLDVDEAKIRGALLNLVANSVNATRPGDTIALGASVDVSGEQIELVVEDSGPGIPAALRNQALERFARPGSRAAGGSGLGLAIVKAVSEAHGGYVVIEDSALGGARVAMVLPMSLSVTNDEDSA